MNTERLHELIDAWRDGILTEEAAAELSQMLRDSDEARQIFRGESQLHGLLHRAVAADAMEDAAAGHRVCRVPPATSRGVEPPRLIAALMRSGRLRFAGAASLAVCLVAAGIWLCVAPRKPEPPDPIATLTRCIGCVWAGPSHPQPGDRLSAGILALDQGLAEVKLANGVDLLIEAPTRLEMMDFACSVLETGRIVARVPPAARGYAVDTLKAKFIDLGTEFGISVEPDRETVAQVFDGVVVAEVKEPDASGKRSHRIVAGEMVRIDAWGAVELQRVAFSHERFLRTFSRPSVHDGDELIPFKPSQIASLDVVTAPGPVIIDGDLSDWDLASAFDARCAEPFGESYHLRGLMMHDAQYLYIGARVGDPMPMRNVIDPNSDPWSAWMGGSVQLRLSTDRTFGWPLKAARGAPRQVERDEQDTSDRIIHLTLWYFQPREQPCLEIRYGMMFDRGVVNPPGWRGAFHKALDGTSYTVECAIPWTLLGADSDPPQAGDELGLCWTVNWSDASGKRWKGQLVEIKNPVYADRGKTLTFDVAETWGRAVYR